MRITDEDLDNLKTLAEQARAAVINAQSKIYEALEAMQAADKIQRQLQDAVKATAPNT